MNEQEIKNMVTSQRRYFYTGATLDVDARIQALNKLKASILKHEDDIHEALKKDQ